MSTEKYISSCQRWEKICKDTFGSKSVDWRLDYKSGKIFFSKNGRDKIKATPIFIGYNLTKGSKSRWYWAWNSKPIKLIPELDDKYRLIATDIQEYIADGKTLDNIDLFNEPTSTFDNNINSDREKQLYIRSVVLDIMEGDFIFEGEIMHKKTPINVIFVLKKPKRCKEEVKAPEKDDMDDQNEKQEDDQEDSKKEET